jgi:hypothetical protein
MKLTVEEQQIVVIGDCYFLTDKVYILLWDTHKLIKRIAAREL